MPRCRAIHISQHAGPEVLEVREVGEALRSRGTVGKVVLSPCPCPRRGIDHGSW